MNVFRGSTSKNYSRYVVHCIFISVTKDVIDLVTHRRTVIQIEKKREKTMLIVVVLLYAEI